MALEKRLYVEEGLYKNGTGVMKTYVGNASGAGYI